MAEYTRPLQVLARRVVSDTRIWDEAVGEMRGIARAAVKRSTTAEELDFAARDMRAMERIIDWIERTAATDDGAIAPIDEVA